VHLLVSEIYIYQNARCDDKKKTLHQCAHGVDSTVQEYTHLLKTFPSVILRMSLKRLNPPE